MQQFGKVRIEHDRITTPNGQIPLNANSTVTSVFTPAKQYVKKAVGVGLLVAAVATGGAGLLLFAPGWGFIFHQSYQVIVNTNEEDFLVAQFSGGAFSDPQGDARDLRQAISNAISNLQQ